MRRTNRWVGVAIVLSAVVAACVGTLSLTSVQQKSITVTPSPVDFGMVLQNTSSEVSVTITPKTQNDVDRVTSIVKSNAAGTSCASFEVMADGLPVDIYCKPPREGSAFAGSSYGGGDCVPIAYVFRVRFTPAVKGPANCPVEITYTSTGYTGVGSGGSGGSGGGSGGSGSGSGSPPITDTLVLQGIGVAPPVAIAVSPQMMSFGDVPVAQTSSPQRLTVTNIGSEAVNLEVSSSNSKFTVTQIDDGTSAEGLHPDTVASYDVRCAMPMQGSNAGIVTVTPLENPALSKTVSLGCNGINSALVIDPSPAAFAADTLVGAQPPELEISITNAGSASVSVATSLGSNAHELVLLDSVERTLSMGQSANVRVRYEAATEFPYGQLGTLVVMEGNTPRNVALNGEALPGAIGASPTIADFGPVCGGVEVPFPVAVYTTAAGAVSVNKLSDPEEPFAVSATQELPYKLLGNHGNMMMLNATVNAPSEGLYEGVFGIETNIPNADSRLDIPVKALVLAPGLTPTPDVLHFGPGKVGSLTTAQEVTISNCSASDLGITSAALAGEGAADFAIVSTVDLTTQTIPQKDKLTIPLVMNPQTEGTKVAQLVVTMSDGSTVTVGLDGNGFTGEASGGDSLGTYYTCSAGGAGGAASLAPIGLALMLVRRRRAARVVA